MPPKNKRGAARHPPAQQPSLLDQLELDEGPGREGDPHNYRERNRENDLQREDPGHEVEDRHAGEAAAQTADPHPGAAGDPDEQTPGPLEKAYSRYTEIVNDTYDSKFSDAKRQAAFKEAAKAHGVRITDLKRYSTAAALGIPYQTDAEDGAGTEPDPGAAPLGPDTSETD